MADTTSTQNKTAKQLIDEQYQNLIKAQTENITADYKNSKAQYQSQMDKSDETYQPLRNEAYVNNALAERTRRENMANMGLSGEGGTSLTLQQRNTGSLLGTLGDVSRQQRSYEDELNLESANLDTTYEANLGSVEADYEAQKIAAQLSQGQFEDNYALSENNLKLSQGNAKAAQVMELLNKGLITKRQAKEYLDYSKDTGFDQYFDYYFG